MRAYILSLYNSFPFNSITQVQNTTTLISFNASAFDYASIICILFAYNYHCDSHSNVSWMVCDVRQCQVHFHICIRNEVKLFVPFIDSNDQTMNHEKLYDKQLELEMEFIEWNCCGLRIHQTAAICICVFVFFFLSFIQLSTFIHWISSPLQEIAQNICSLFKCDIWTLFFCNRMNETENIQFENIFHFKISVFFLNNPFYVHFKPVL